MTHTYNITGMTCSSCTSRVKSELLKLGDVLSANIQLQAPQAEVSMQKHISLSALQTAISKAGNYTITESGHGPAHDTGMAADAEGTVSYYPIFLIFGYIAGVSLVAQLTTGSFVLMDWMRYFMAGFFFVFSFFKMMNLKGFADGYGMYDVVAKHSKAYAYLYPFIELALGIAFLTGFSPVFTNIATLVVMGVSTIGVVQNLMQKTPFQCACLGTVIKLPLSKVTLFEDLLMVAMSAYMLVTLL